MTVTDVKLDQCRLCTRQKEQEVFVVKSQGFTGQVCAKHLYILVEQAKPQQPTLP
jgi:hypothetical protein